MNCEICHKAPASAAILKTIDGREEELYVCDGCAKVNAEETQKRERAEKRESEINGMNLTIHSLGGDEPPPFISEIIDAVNGVFKKMEPKGNEFSCARIDKDFRIGDRIHLEALHLSGELDFIIKDCHRMGVELIGVESDALKDVGHVYKVFYTCALSEVKKVVSDLIVAERDARTRLVKEMPRVFEDAIGRALALLKNCRLLTPGELFDLLSPLRIASRESLLNGITSEEIDEILLSIDVSGYEDTMDSEECDKLDARRADEINMKFAGVDYKMA